MADALAKQNERIRMRLRHDPGDELVIEGKLTPVVWPIAITRLAPGLLAEVVIDLELQIMTYPAAAWTGSREELLQLGWARTMMATELAVGEVELGGHTIFMVHGEAPYVTAAALNPCQVFGPPNFPSSAGALVAVPTTGCVLAHPFADASWPNKGRVAAFVAALAQKLSSEAQERERVSEHVYFARADREYTLEYVG